MPRPKLIDVAKATGLSISTVSMALRDYPDVSAATRMRVREVCQQVNYRPRRKTGRVRPRERKNDGPASRPRSTRVALALVGYEQKPDLQSITAASSPLRDVLTEGEWLNCRFEISSITQTDETAQARQLHDVASEVDAIILDGFVTPALLKASAALQVPAILMGAVYGDPLHQLSIGYQVTQDMRAMGHLATRTLIEAGHRRIGFVCSQVFQNLYTDQWLSGYRHAHVDAGLAVEKGLLMIMGGAPHVGMRAAKQMREMKRPPTGVVIPDAGTAAMFLEAMRNLGHELPVESVVIGGSREQTAQNHLENYPNVAMDLKGMASATLALLTRAVEGEAIPFRQVLVPFPTANLPRPDSAKV